MKPPLLPNVVRLQSGGSALIRRIACDDAQALQQFIRDLSPASRYRRFLRGIRELPADSLTRFTQPDPARDGVLVATLLHPWPSGCIIGMAQYAGTDDAEGSEIAVVVGDAWQRQGLGYHLLGTLLNFAVEAGIERIQADVLADNHAMRQLAHKLGCEIAGNPAAPFLVRVIKTLAPKDPSLSVGSWFPMFPPRHLIPRFSPKRRRCAARACRSIDFQVPSPPQGEREWYGLPLTLRHQMCQIGDGFSTNHEKGE
jgi:acetyltransferase